MSSGLMSISRPSRAPTLARMASRRTCRGPIKTQHRPSSRPSCTFSGPLVSEAAYNPRVLIAVLNIYRIYYKWFDPRSYVSELNEEEATEASTAGNATQTPLAVAQAAALAASQGRMPAEAAQACIDQADAGDASRSSGSDRTTCADGAA